MISPKYATTHYYLSVKTLSQSKTAPHIVNLYLDYNCPFSAKLFLKFYGNVIPELQRDIQISINLFLSMLFNHGIPILYY